MLLIKTPSILQRLGDSSRSLSKPGAGDLGIPHESVQFETLKRASCYAFMNRYRRFLR